MKYRYDGYAWVLRLEKGEKLMACLNELIAQEKVESAWISGLGGVLSAEIGFYNLPAQTYDWRQFDELMEITALQGNIAVDEAGKPVIHLHGTFGRSDMSAIGGHVKDFEVAGTCEVFVYRWQAEKLIRRRDDEVGLSLLDL